MTRRTQSPVATDVSTWRTCKMCGNHPAMRKRTWCRTCARKKQAVNEAKRYCPAPRASRASVNDGRTREWRAITPQNAVPEYSKVGGIEISTLREERKDGADEERARRVEIYARHIEECGEIRWLEACEGLRR